MNRVIRYQGAIYQDHHILLIKHRHHDTSLVYWVVPGGGIEDGETEEECVIREMKEETHLWDAIILDDPYTYPQMRSCQKLLGYVNDGAPL